MAQTFTSTEVTTTTNVFGDNRSQRTNENTLRSNFSGATQPSDPVVGQQWYDTANSKTWQYNGAAWVPIDTNSTTQVDVSNAKGNLTTLTNYLRVAHNDDGTLKTSPATAIDEFKDNALVITYVSTSSFTVPTDLTSIFTTNRKLKVYLSTSTVITYIASSSYNSGTNVTTVVMGDAVLDPSVTAVKFSIVQYGERHDTMHTSDLSMYAHLDSPALTGIPTAPTAAKFTAGTQLTTLDYALSIAGNQAGVVTYTDDTTLTALDCGKLIVCSGASDIALTLPTTLDPHMVLRIKKIGTGGVTISGGTIYTLTGVVTSLALMQYTTITLACDGTYWHEISSGGGDRIVKQLLGTTGYRVYESGKIEQWGTGTLSGTGSSLVAAVTFPMAFANHLLLCVPNLDYQSAPIWVWTSLTSKSLTGCQICFTDINVGSNSPSKTFNYFAIGD